MKVLSKQVYRFEGVELDPYQGCLRRDGEELAVRQKSLQALLYLVEQRHRLVTKEELIERVWEGMAVTDDALVQLIKEIRQSLGDDPRLPRFIKTVPRAGYRFIAPVEEFWFDLPVPLEMERQTSVEIEYEEEITATRREWAIGRLGEGAMPQRRFLRLSRSRHLLVIVVSLLLVVGSSRYTSQQDPSVPMSNLPR